MKKALGSLAFATGGAMAYQFQQKRQFFRPALAQPIRKEISLYRPTDYVHLQLCAATEQGKVIATQLPQGWKSISAPNANHVAAYCNEIEQHIIITHDNSQELGHYMALFKEYTRVEAQAMASVMKEAEATAWAMASAIKFAQGIIDERGPKYKYSFTGFGFGALLAQLNLCKFEQDRHEYDENQHAIASAVTFNGVGARAALESLQPNAASEYRVDLDRLDLKNYLTLSSLDENLDEQVGTTLMLTVKEAQSAKDLLPEFSVDTGLPNKQVYTLQPAYHQTLPLRHIDTNVRKFLQNLAALDAHETVKQTLVDRSLAECTVNLQCKPISSDRAMIINFLLEDTLDRRLEVTLNEYKIESDNLVFDRRTMITNASDFVKMVSDLLNAYPDLYTRELNGQLRDRIDTVISHNKNKMSKM